MRQIPLPNTLAPAKPFVKWVGGKRSLLHELLPRVPANFNNYVEPFLGGGALFFALKNKEILKITGGGGGQATLNDINPDLITAWQVVQTDVEPLITLLKQHAQNHSRDHYYRIRKQHRLTDKIERAARLIYLNKTCYNGLWRVNSRGEFNVPIGSAVNPAICQESNLRACHRELQNVAIAQRDFRQIQAGHGDFVYLDPPYHPLVGGSFTDYARAGFAEAEQTDLRDLCRELHKNGAMFMLSNSDTDFIRDLYADSIFTIETVQAPRMVNRKPDQRGPVNELLIRNY